MKSIIDKPFGLLLLFCGLIGIDLFVFFLLIDTRVPCRRRWADPDLRKFE